MNEFRKCQTVKVCDSFGNTEIQAYLMSFLAYPFHERDRANYYNALIQLNDLKDFHKVSPINKVRIQRARKKIFFLRCRAASIANNAFQRLRENKVVLNENDVLEASVNSDVDYLGKTGRFKDQESLWDFIWGKSSTVLPLALTISELIQETRLPPERLVVDENWIDKAIINTELNYFLLAAQPIYSFDRNRALRFIKTSMSNLDIKFKSCGAEVPLFMEIPQQKAIEKQDLNFDFEGRARRDPSPKRYKRREPYFIKVVREADLSPEFDWEYGVRARKKGVSPTILPDTNVLKRMLEFMQVYSEWDDFEGSGLDEVFAKLKLGPTIYFSPAMAYSEGGENAFTPTKRAVDFLIEKFVPGLMDEKQFEGEKKTKKFDVGKTEYKKLSNGMKTVTCVSYLTILKAMLIKRKYDYLGPKEKFFALLNYMSARANSMHAFPIEAAKHYFWDRSKEGQASEFGKLSKDIKSNFFKGGSTIEKIKLSAMNSARDMSYAMMAANYIAVDQDFWLVTFDKGLHSFFQTAYLEPETLGAASNRFKAAEFQERRQHPYWEMVDMLHLYHTAEREKAGVSSFDQERINNCISETEQELEGLI